MKWLRTGIVIALLAVFLIWAMPRKNSGADAADALIQLAVNALVSDSGSERCEAGEMQGNCSGVARVRRALGLPPPPLKGPVAVGNALTLQLALESVHLLPTVSRNNDFKTDDSLLVRVTNGQMWMDFSGMSREGLELKVSIALDSEGGTPVKLAASVGDKTREIALIGKPRLANDRKFLYLVPESGEGNPKYANWLGMPNPALPKTYSMLASKIRNIDPVFLPGFVKVVFASVSANSIEEGLGLYPPLKSIERRAAALRAMQAELWMPEQQVELFVNKNYPGDPIARAAWALAICESVASSPVINEDCWYRFTSNDPDVTNMLGSDVAQLQELYEPLGTGHPLYLRLNRLRDALQKTELKKAELARLRDIGS